MSYPHRRTLALSLAALLTGSSLAACATAEDSTDTTNSASTASATSTASGKSDAATSITVQNCGSDVTIKQPVERAFFLNAASVPTLHAIGVMDKVVARAGVFPPEYFDAATQAEINKIPSLVDRVDAVGHLTISKEEVLSKTPDLVLGDTDTINAQTLAPHKIPVIEEPAFCGAIERKVTWNDVWDQIKLYGEIFQKSDAADKYIEQLKKRVSAAEKEIAKNETDKELSVAVLYPEVGGTVTYAYGIRSMSAPVVESAGLRNVFGDTDDRVFEVSAEEILARKPDIIIALYSEGDPAKVTEEVKKLRGAGSLPAVKNDAVYPMLLHFAEPATPLAVDGLEKLAENLRDYAARSK